LFHKENFCKNKFIAGDVRKLPSLPVFSSSEYLPTFARCFEFSALTALPFFCSIVGFKLYLEKTEMANIKSAQKNIRKSATNAKRNRSVKSRLKTIAKSAKAACASGDAAAIASVTPTCASVFDKATKSGVIHPNKAARMKSRLAKAANKAKAAA